MIYNNDLLKYITKYQNGLNKNNKYIVATQMPSWYCTFILWAVENGNLNILKWLCINQKRYVIYILDTKSKYKHVHILQWLHKNTNVIHTPGGKLKNISPNIDVYML